MGGGLMYVPLGIKTDYSLLQSLIKIKSLIAYAKDHNLTTLAIVDENLFYVMEFYTLCLSNHLKPIIGLEITINNQNIYLYAKNYPGYLTLLKINTLKQERELTISDLILNNYELLCIIPYNSNELYQELSSIFQDLYIGYSSEYEKNNALIITNKIVYLNIACALNEEDSQYLSYLPLIKEGKTVDEVGLTPNFHYLCPPETKEDEETTIQVANLLNVTIPLNKRYIPQYDVPNSEEYLTNLARKGLFKRCNGNIPEIYKKRLEYELKVITEMGFVDYFLIVYDYVKYAKTHDILAWPRGSAAGSLVSYVIGISEVDPIKYNLLFERFLNPERVTMPDIDVDFDYTKREEVINYVKDKYGHDKVAAIMTFGTLASKQVIRDVAKLLNLPLAEIDQFTKLIDAKLSLKENYSNPQVQKYLQTHPAFLDVYKISSKLEGLKRHISTHAAGIVISSVTLDEIIPICKNNDEFLTGITFEYLESLGLLKMDFLALRNLNIIKNVLNLIKENEHQDLKLSNIPLNDPLTINVFKNVDTEGIFQFESNAMKPLLRKLKVNTFSDIIAAIALVRPGPGQSINSFVARKEGSEKITYLDPVLKPILSDTYGIIIYQEQIMQILVTMAGYSFAEADNIRRAVSKKKHEVMANEETKFIERAVAKGHSQEVAKQVYDLIIRFADYGFNKAHSVSYALLGYQMAYLKCHYPAYFFTNLLNMSIGSEIKTKQYIDEVKRKNLKVIKSDINTSGEEYKIVGQDLIMPLSIIKGIGINISHQIVEERNQNGLYTDYFNFVVRTYRLGITKKTLEILIQAGTLDSLNLNRETMLQNLDNALNYALLCNDLDESLVLKPLLTEYKESDVNRLMQQEQELYGFYVSSHPANKYTTPDIIKINTITQYFDKYVKMVCLVSNIRKIKTKKNEDMAFFTASDETGSMNFIIFPNKNSLLKLLKNDKLYMINGQVTRKDYDYQIVVNSITEM